MRPIITVIIPVYNVERYLEKCLESILHHKRHDFEVILVDDGSKDKSSEICDRYAQDTRVSVFHVKNGGPSRARNIGIEKAKGKYVTFVDSDDYVAEDYFEVLINQINNEDYDLVYFSIAQFYTDGCVTYFKREPFAETNRNAIEERLLSLKHNSQQIETFSFTVNKCFKLDIILEENIRFEEKLSMREDEIFTNEYCRQINSIKYLDSVLYFYRIGNTSLTHKKRTLEELLLLTRKMKISSSWVANSKLKSFQLSRIMSFYLDAIANVFFPPISVVNEIYVFFKENKRDGIYGRYNKIYNKSRFVSMVSLYFFNLCVHTIRLVKQKIGS